MKSQIRKEVKQEKKIGDIVYMKAIHHDASWWQIHQDLKQGKKIVDVVLLTYSTANLEERISSLTGCVATYCELKDANNWHGRIMIDKIFMIFIMKLKPHIHRHFT